MAKQKVQINEKILLCAVYLTSKFEYCDDTSYLHLSQAAAEASLVLDQFLLEPGRQLSVAISDPERKKERTDADADQREVHVGGLNRTVVRDDLQSLFSRVNSFTHRMQLVTNVFDSMAMSKMSGWIWTNVGETRDSLSSSLRTRRVKRAVWEATRLPFTHKTSAMAALAANNSELKRRRIAVTLSDPRAPAHKCVLL